MKRNSWFIFMVLFLLLSSLTMASTYERILLDNPEIINNSLNKSYELAATDLRLPKIGSGVFNEKAQNKLIDLASLYGAREENVYNLLDSELTDQFDEYRLSIEKDADGNVMLLTPLPGILLNAEYDKNEEDDTVEENANISLNYWMNNRTLFRAEYGRENREWWDIRDIRLEDSDDNFDDDNDEDLGDDSFDPKDNDTENIEDSNSTDEEYRKELIFNKERNETSRLGISYMTNDYLTISADYINDFASLERDYSTLFGLEYKDDLGSLRYHYQLDYGDERAKETGLEFGYRDLATFNATYKIYNPETIEEQLNQWDFGIGLNINEISTLSFEYQVRQERFSETLLAEEDEDESNIKAQLEIKF